MSPLSLVKGFFQKKLLDDPALAWMWRVVSPARIKASDPMDL